MRWRDDIRALADDQRTIAGEWLRGVTLPPSEIVIGATSAARPVPLANGIFTTAQRVTLSSLPNGGYDEEQIDDETVELSSPFDDPPKEATSLHHCGAHMDSGRGIR